MGKLKLRRKTRNLNSRAQPENATVALKARPQSHRPKLIIACLILEFSVRNSVPQYNTNFYKMHKYSQKVSCLALPKQNHLFTPVWARHCTICQIPDVQVYININRFRRVSRREASEVPEMHTIYLR